MIDWLLNEFPTWFSTGLYHILDIEGYDHMLFLWCLCIRYSMKTWKSVLWLITAFTVGHSITLITSTLGWRPFSSSSIEIAIAVTILISAILPFIKNIIASKSPFWDISVIERTSITYYFLAIIFGFIHGMGFSGLLIDLLGRESNIVGPLLGFNLGIEFGQLFFVFALLVISSLLQTINPIIQLRFIFISLGASILLSIQMIVDRTLSLFQ